MKPFLLVILCLWLLLFFHKVIKKKVHIWLPSYIFWHFKNKNNSLKESNRPVHIMFLVVDHFEPGPNEEIVTQWIEKYPNLAQRHRDADSRPPKHTWFYPSERAAERVNQLQMLTQLTELGFGEIELHLHHSNDTEETLRKKLRAAKQLYNDVGALITVDERISFGFVHGDWALDNSIIINNKNLCGVNNELTVLKEEGCYADFTFPALGTAAQPKKINSIYYAKDDPLKPKSYNTGIDVVAGRSYEGNDLMIIQGPLIINLNKSIYFLGIENGAVEDGYPLYKARVDQWVKANVHVKGKPDWLFIKIHTHGATPGSMDIFLNGGIDEIYSYLETKYNDGVNYFLHYVTAREAYNIIKAAEAGLSGNPDRYRDYTIKPYKNSFRSVMETPFVPRV